MSQQENKIELELDLIVSDKELEVRAAIDEDTVQDYFDAMETEEDLKKFPAITVYFDGCRHWLADGHHRFLAALRRGYKKMRVEVIDGTHDEAILAAVKLNFKNGLRFNEDDWEKIVKIIAGKEHWKDWSNRKLAAELNCGETTIRRYRPDNSVAPGGAPEKRMGKDGKMYPAKAKSKQPKPETNPDTAPTSPPVETEAPQAEKVSTDPDRATDVDTGDVAETAPPEIPASESRPIRGESPRFVEAREEQAAILADIEAVVQRINKWFDNFPASLHKSFGDLLDERFREIISASKSKMPGV